jgi:hypothetical protein
MSEVIKLKYSVPRFPLVSRKAYMELLAAWYDELIELMILKNDNQDLRDQLCLLLSQENKTNKSKSKNKKVNKSK